MNAGDTVSVLVYVSTFCDIPVTVAIDIIANPNCHAKSVMLLLLLFHLCCPYESVTTVLVDFPLSSWVPSVALSRIQ